MSQHIIGTGPADMKVRRTPAPNLPMERSRC